MVVWVGLGCLAALCLVAYFLGVHDGKQRDKRE